jgi:crossover junction endodeoxyribonuclease RuvC
LLVLAVDPGIATTGYGIIRSQAGEISHIDYGVISTSSRLEPAQRLNKIFERMTELIELNKPNEVAAEPKKGRSSRW